MPKGTEMCEWICGHCNKEMISIANGVTWCSNCGKITSMFAPEMIPAISQIIFEAKKSKEQKTTDQITKIKIIS